MNKLHSCLIIILLFLASCKPACPIQSCHVRKQHYHGKRIYRGQPIFAKQNPKIGEKMPRKSAQDNQESQRKTRKKKK